MMGGLTTINRQAGCVGRPCTILMALKCCPVARRDHRLEDLPHSWPLHVCKLPSMLVLWPLSLQMTAQA